MTEEEKKELEKLEELSHYCALKNIDREDNKFGEFVVAIQKIENLIQKQQEEIEKKDEQINELEDKLSLIEEYYDISDLEQIIKEDM